MRPAIHPGFAVAMTLALLMATGPAIAETPAPVLLVIHQSAPQQENRVLRMAGDGALLLEQQPAPLPGQERASRIGRLETAETLTVLGVAGAAATLGLVTGGVSYGVAAGAAIILVYSLLP